MAQSSASKIMKSPMKITGSLSMAGTNSPFQEGQLIRKESIMVKNINLVEDVIGEASKSESSDDEYTDQQGK